MRTPSRPLSALALLVAALLPLLVAGCGGAGAHDDADVAFATQMVPHHRQAVQMSDDLLTKTGVDPDVLALAQTIKGEQAPEIDRMTGWLQDWGAPAPATSGTGEMGGMLSQQQLDELAKASGQDAQRLYLQGMIGHHQGAVAMAQTEITDGRNADAVALARSIVTSQQAEIDRMQQLQAD